MGSFMSKHSAAARERKALLGNMPVDNKASALNYDDPGDEKSKFKGYTKEEKEAIKQRVYNRSKRGGTESVFTESELAKDVRSGKVKKQ